MSDEHPWMEPCPTCDGEGTMPRPIFGDWNLGSDVRTCPECHGEGEVQRHAAEGAK